MPGCSRLVRGSVGEGEGRTDVLVGVRMALGALGEVSIWRVMLVSCVLGVFLVLWRLLANMCGKNSGCCCRFQNGLVCPEQNKNNCVHMARNLFSVAACLSCER